MPEQPRDHHIHLPDGSCCSSRKFAHLHQHTQFSMLDGAAKIKELLGWVKQVTPDDPACAITDHGNMHGAVKFYTTARELGVKPIIGFEAYVAAGSRFDRPPRGKGDGEKGTFHLTMLAQDLEGYRNLCRLSSESYMTGYYYKPRIDRELIAEHASGIICLSGCMGSEVSSLILADNLDEARRRLEWYASVFGDRYFVELQRHGRLDSRDPQERELASMQVKINQVLLSWARELGLPTVATNDGHYVRKEDAGPHDTLLAMQQGKRVEDPDRLRFSCDDFYVKTPEELRELMPVEQYGEEVFDNTRTVADLCQDDYLPVGKKRVYLLPEIQAAAGRSPSEELRYQSYQGMRARYPELRDATWRQYAIETYLLLPRAQRQAIAQASGKEKFEHIDDQLDFLARAGSFSERSANEQKLRITPYPALEALRTKDGISEEEHTLLSRVEYELGVIGRMGFSDYFLIVSDYINWAKDNGVAVGPGRGCLSPEVPIRMADGRTKPIGEIRVGERVITRDGSPRTVLDAYEYPCTEELYRIRSFYGDTIGVTLTHDHEVLAEPMRRVPEYKAWTASIKRLRRSIQEPTGELSWIKARDLKPGDWVFTPIPQQEQAQPEEIDLASLCDGSSTIERDDRVEEYTLNVLAGTRQLRANLPSRIAFDERFAHFLGIFAGNGWLRSQASGRNRDASFSIGFHSGKTAQVEEIEAYMASLGIQTSRHAHPTSKLIEVEICSRVLHTVMAKLFSEYSYTAQSKHIPDAIMAAPDAIKAAFLRGLIETDSHLDEAKVRITTTSQAMAEQVRSLLLSLRIPSQLDREHRNDVQSGYGGERDSFSIDFPHDQRLTGRKAAQLQTWRPVSGGILTQVMKVELVQSTGTVHDLKVETNHDYLTSSFIVHNSGAGSIVAYATRITNLDPIKFKLLFERFLNPDRVSMPDFDIDFDDRNRSKVIQYVREKYGEDRVAQIATFSGLNSKQVLKDVGKALGRDFKEMNELTRLIPIKLGKSTPLPKALELPEVQAFLREHPELEEVYHSAMKLEGLTKASSVHAAGIVIGNQPLQGIVPLMLDRRKEEGDGAGMAVTQFDMKAVEDIGLVKMDFLGLRTLSLIVETLRVLRQQGIELDIDEIPLDDPRTLELISQGRTLGVFQLEGSGITAYARQMRPQGLDDIIALSALYRPGPMDNIPTYIRRLHGEAIDYSGFEASQEKLAPILDSTYGIPVYQEQIMQIASDVAGYTLGEADLLRRCIAEGTLITDAATGRQVPIEDVQPGMQVMSLRPDGKFEAVPVSGRMDNGTMETYRVRTRSGREVRMTGDHRLLTLQGWKPLGELQIGSSIATPITLEATGAGIPAADAAQIARARLLGMLISDGGMRSGDTVRARFYSKDKEQVQEFERLARAHGAAARRDVRPTTGVTTVRCAREGERNGVLEIIKATGIDRPSGEQHIPDEVFTYGREALRNFIGALWNGDGSIERDRISYGSKSPSLIRGLKHLLLRFGLPTIDRVKRSSTGDQHELIITDRSLIPRFADEFSSTLTATKEQALRRLNAEAAGRRASQGIFDIPAEIASIIAAEKRSSGLSWTQAGQAAGVDGNRLSSGISLLKPNHRSLSRGRIARMAKGFGSEQLDQIASSEVLWDPIVNIEPAGQARVYDLSVPPHANFVAADMVVHNCMGKKDHDEMARQAVKFKQGAADQGIPEAEAERIFALLNKFADYGFNLSHAAAYGVISYQTAYLKANFPMAFAAALMTTEQHNAQKLAEYISDARSQGIEVLPPDVNCSKVSFEIEQGQTGKAIRFGLSALKGVSEELVLALMESREQHGPFRSFQGYIQRAVDGKEPRLYNKTVLESLARAGAFDSLRVDELSREDWRADLLSGVEGLLKDIRKHEARARKVGGQTDLFGNAPTLEVELPRSQGASMLEMLAWEKDTAGVYISGHPLQQVPELAAARSGDLEQLPEMVADHLASGDSKGRGPRVLLAGIMEGLEVKTTKKGQSMGILNFSDGSASARILCFPSSFEQLGARLRQLDESPLPIGLIVQASPDENGDQGELLLSLEAIVSEEEVRQCPEVALVEIMSEQVSESVSVLGEIEECRERGGIEVWIRLVTPEEFAVHDTGRWRFNRHKLEEKLAGIPGVTLSSRRNIDGLLQRRRRAA